MPTYVYRREDGTTFEIEQRITEDPLSVCPETNQPVRRVISGTAGLIFKGSGFYLTDYARSGSNGSRSAEKTDGSSNGSSSENTTTSESGGTDAASAKAA